MPEVVLNISMCESFPRFLLELVVRIESKIRGENMVVDKVVDKIIHLLVKGKEEPFDGDSECRELFLVF